MPAWLSVSHLYSADSGKISLMLPAFPVSQINPEDSTSWRCIVRSAICQSDHLSVRLHIKLQHERYVRKPLPLMVVVHEGRHGADLDGVRVIG